MSKEIPLQKKKKNDASAKQLSAPKNKNIEDLKLKKEKTEES
jgi:hypothetical protein